MTRDEFEHLYECPWDVRGANLEDVDSIYEHYRNLMLSSTSIDEINEIRKEFGPFCWGMTTTDPSPFTFEELQDFISGKRNPAQEELDNTNIAHLILPQVMLQAYLIKEKFGLPEFYAGLQCVRAIIKWDDEND